MSVALEPKTRRQWSVLVIQLGSVDEIFRSLMALKAVKHLYPEIKLSVITRPETSAPLKRVDWLDSVIETPSVRKEVDPVPKVASWIDQVIGAQSYDLLVNWTSASAHSRMAAILSTLIPALVKFGVGLRDDLTLIAHDAWSIYQQVWAHGQSGVEQDIHQTDIITTQLLTALQIHVGDPSPEAGVSVVTSKYFFKMIQSAVPDRWSSRKKSLKWVAIHCLSLGERAEEWIEMVLRRHPDVGVVILGETPSAIEISSERVIDLSSQTHFDSSVQVLSQCHWLISGPAPVVSLASLLNTRVFQVVQGEGLKWIESGPYGNTHLVAQFSNEWEPETAYAVWSHAQSEWFHRGKISLADHAQNLGLYEAVSELKIYRSRIRPATEGGGVSYDRLPLNSNLVVPTDFDTWMYRIRGQMARAWFCGWAPPIEEESKSFKLNPELLRRIRTLQESLGVLRRVILEGRETSRSLELTSGSVRATYLMSAEDRLAIEEFGKKLLEIEGLISRVTQVEASLSGFLKIYQGVIHHLRGETIPEMAKETTHAFDLVLEGMDLLESYLKTTLELARPKSVSPAISSSVSLGSAH